MAHSHFRVPSRFRPQPLAAVGRTLGLTLFLAAALVLPLPSLVAQSPAYIPLDDPVTALVDALVARGEFPSLSALERPYRAGDVRAALDRSAAASTQARRGPARWYSAVARAVALYSDTTRAAPTRALRVGAMINPFVTAQTTGRREIMLADTVGRGGYPGADVRLSMEAPSFAAVTRLRIDKALEKDPEFAGKSDRVIAARMEDAYIATRWTYVALDAGRLARNWGPPQLQGMQLSNYADSYDHVQLRLGVDRLHLTTIAARLDDIRVATDTVAQRYFTIHRLAARWRQLELAASEAVVYGGPARGFQPGLANPVALYDLAQYDEKQSLNASYGLDVALRTSGRGLYSAQLLVDDFQLDRCGAVCTEPASLGGTLSAEAVPLSLGDAVGFGSYTRIDNLTYRTVSPWERYTTLNLSLGRGQVDYDELRAGVELAPPLGGPLRVYAAVRRQGEGDYRLRFPRIAEYPDTPTIFAGVVERVRRVGATWSGSGRVSFLADLGYQTTSNADHVAGRTRSGLEGRVKISLTPGLRFGGVVNE